MELLSLTSLPSQLLACSLGATRASFGLAGKDDVADEDQITLLCMPSGDLINPVPQPCLDSEFKLTLRIAFRKIECDFTLKTE